MSTTRASNRHAIITAACRGLAGAALVAILLAVLLLAAGYLADATPRLVAARLLTPAERIFIGTAVECAVTVACPYYRLPTREPQVAAPAGCQPLPAGPRAWRGLGLTTWTWETTVVLQPVELGPQKGGKADVAFTPGRQGLPDIVAVSLPEFEVKPRVPEDETVLKVASRLPASVIPGGYPAWVYILAAALLVAVVAGLWLLLRRREKARLEIIVPPWDRALAAVQELLNRLPLDPETFFVELTDILRRYCEARALAPHATAATTPEFLEAVRRNPNLTLEQQQALRGFLTAADLIKFARAQATQEQMLDALHAGRRFVVETTPAPPPPGQAPHAVSPG